ncbi:MAG: Hsp70 family protein [Blastocatellia bacterium]|nr:Hsp70 family protein [Blastocatellia bacterium]
MEQTIGIDLGESYCRMAWLKGAGDSQIITNSDNERFMPAVLAMHPDGQLLAGRSALQLASIHPERGVRRLLSLLAAGEPVLLNGQSFQPETLAAHLLRHLKAGAEAHLNEKIARATVAIPPTCDRNVRDRLCEAGSEARLNLVPIESAVAATLAAGFRQPADRLHRILVYDLGALNFHVTTLALDRSSLSILKTATIEDMGGASFDRQIVDYVTVLVQQQHKVDPFANDRFMTELRKQAEQVKISLGSQRVADVVIVGMLRESTGALADVEVEIEREEFERMIQEQLQSTIAATRQVLARSNLLAEEIDSVILVGGSTHIPLVKTMVQNLFEPEKLVKGIDPAECVALGAALSGQTSGIEIQPTDYASAIVTVPIPTEQELRIADGATPSEDQPVAEVRGSRTTIVIGRSETAPASAEDEITEDDIPTEPPVPEQEEVASADMPEDISPVVDQAVSAESPIIDSHVKEEEVMPESPHAFEEVRGAESEEAPPRDAKEFATTVLASQEGMSPDTPSETDGLVAESPDDASAPSGPKAAAIYLEWNEETYLQRRRKVSTPAFVSIDMDGFQLATPSVAEGTCLDSTHFYLGSPVPESIKFTLMMKKDEDDENIRAVMIVPLPPDLSPGTLVTSSLGIDYDTGVPFITLTWQEPHKEEFTSITCRDWALETEEPALSLAETESQAENIPAIEDQMEAENRGAYGKYEPLQLLESGGRFQTFLSREPETDVPVLLKVFTPEDERAKSAFLSSLLPVNLMHPNVVRVCDFGKAQAGFYLVTEYMNGGTLRDLMMKEGEKKPVPVEQALVFIHQVCDGLQAIHQKNIFHRNIKPTNVLIDPEGQVAKISDFDIAVSLRAREYTAHAAGTLPYMAKEVLEGHADHRADIYALGVMLFELLTGRLPFMATSQRQLADQIKEQQPPDPRSLNPQITEHLNDIILRALEKDVSRRFQTAEEIRDALMEGPVSLFHTITSRN